MIFTDRTITVRKGESRIDEPIVVYRGDYELEVRFRILNSRFKFMSGTNMIESEKASYGQLAILTPYGGNIFSDIVRCNDGSVTFVLTAEMLNQIEEVGLYSFQIRLMDYNKESRVSIPPIEFGIEVREPIASEDHDNSVNNAIVGYSIAKVVDPKEENVVDTFDGSGNYNKTKWETGDRISEGKLNKIEDAIDKINKNEANNTAALSKRTDNNFNVLDSTKADKNEIFTMANMGQDIREAMTGGSVAVVGVDSVTDVNVTPYSLQPYNMSFFDKTSNNLVNPNRMSKGYQLVLDSGSLMVNGEYDTTEYIRVKPETTYITPNVSSFRVIYDADKNFIQGVNTNTITTTSNTAYIKVTFPSGNDYCLIESNQVKDAYDKYILSNNVKINGANIVENSITENKVSFMYDILSENLFDVARITDGFYVEGDEEIPNDKYCYTDFIKVEKYNRYLHNGSDTSYCVVYNDEFKAIKTEATSSIVIPEGGAYIRWSIYKGTNNLDTLMICKNKIPDSYVPHVLSRALDERIKVTAENIEELDDIVKDAIGMQEIYSDNLYDDTKVSKGCYVMHDIIHQNEGFNLTAYIPVEEGCTYVCSGNGGFADVYDKDKKFIYFENTNTLVIPEGGAYIRWSFSSSISNYMISKDKLPNVYVPYHKHHEISNLKIQYANVLNAPNSSHSQYWKDKNWVAIGDSITEWSYADENGVEVNWRKVVTENIGFASSIRCAYWGHKMGDIHEIMEYAGVTEDDIANADIITVSLGQNDKDTPLGSIDDAPSFKQTSFYGDTKGLIEYLLSINNKCTLAFITPTPSNGSEAKLRELSGIIKEVCALYSIPVLDLNRMSNFNSTNYAYFYVDSAVHPNGIGNRRMGRIIAKFIDQL